MAATDKRQRIEIFDTTLRDGEQSPGVSLNADEKVEIARQLACLGVDVIEAGFPAASPGDFEAVQRVAREVDGPVICGLARAVPDDIRRAAEALRDAERPRIHTFISTSDIHIADQMQSTRADVLGQARAAVAHARELCEEVEFSPMDATRADVGFTAEVCAAAVEEGATIINIPDTVGYATPDEYAKLISELRLQVVGLDDDCDERERLITFSVHCHDDLGLAVANSLAGARAGARQIECAVNGIGERAGNASLEEVVMAIITRGEALGLKTTVDTRQLARTSRLVSRRTGYAVPPNKAVVGRNAFAHESGIHQAGVLNNRETFEIIRAEDVGFDSNELVLGKHSGRHALAEALSQLGYELSGSELNAAFKRFKEVADRKKQITALDLEALVSDERRATTSQIKLEWFEVETGSSRRPHAQVILKLPDGAEAFGEADGDGPVNAVIEAISQATHYEVELCSFEVRSVTEGDDALGEASVTLAVNGSQASGRAVSTDIVEAAAEAYVRALSAASA